MRPIGASPTLCLIRSALGLPQPTQARQAPSLLAQVVLAIFIALAVAALLPWRDVTMGTVIHRSFWAALLGGLCVPAFILVRSILGDSRLMMDNPMITKDVREILDTRRAAILLAVFTGALAGTAFMAWPRGDQLLLDIDTVARRLFLVISATLLALVALLAPSLSAVAITGEKERHCFEMLIATGLQERRILGGKLLSSLLHMLILLVASIPFVSIALLLGGIDPVEILSLYLSLFDVAVLFSLIGLASSCLFERNNAALGTAYAIALPLMAILMNALLKAGRPPDLLPLVLLTVTGFGLVRVALMILGTTIQRPRELRVDEDDEESPWRRRAAGLVLDRNLIPDKWLAPPRRRDLLPDGANPVLSKEIRSEIVGQGTLMLRVVIQMALVAVLPAIMFYLMGRPSVFFAYLTLFALLIAPSFACGMFTGEHENGTFTLLATTLLRPRQIVFAKSIAAMRLMLVLLGIIVVPAIVPFLIAHATYHQTALSVIGACMLTCLVWTLALVAIGLTWSLFTQRTTAALIGTYLTGAALALGPLLLFQVIRSFTNLPERWAAFAMPLSPLAHHMALAPTSSLMRQDSAIQWLPLSGGWGGWSLFVAGGMTLTALLIMIMIWRFNSVWRRAQG